MKKKKYSFYFLDFYPEGLESLGTIKNDSILVKGSNLIILVLLERNNKFISSRLVYLLFFLMIEMISFFCLDI